MSETPLQSSRLSEKDALRALAAVDDMLPDDHACDDLFDAGVLSNYHEYAGETVTYITRDGRKRVREAVAEALR